MATAKMWRKVRGYDKYEISTHGEVRSRKYKTPRILKPSINSEGYYLVTLCKNGVRRSVRVNRLVAEAFIPNPNNKPICNHIDGDKTNNKLENLEWMTTSENNAHAFRTGLNSRKGIRNTNAKLDPIQVIKIRELARDHSITDLGEMFDVDPSTVRDVVAKRTWKHVPQQVIPVVMVTC